MPYGIKYRASPSFTISSSQSNLGSMERLYESDKPVAWSRDGTNTPRLNKQLQPKLAPSAKIVRVTKREQIGWKANGKPRYRYFPYHKLVYYFPKGSRKKQRKPIKYVKPNSLQFFTTELTHQSTGSSTLTYVQYPGFTRTISGNLTEIRIPTADLIWGGTDGQGFSVKTYLESNPGNLVQNFIPDISDRALNKLYSNMKGMNVNAAVALAEGNKTLQMIADTANKVAKSLLLAKKGNFLGALHALGITSAKSGSGNYLQYVYGLRPLLQDLDGLMKHIAERHMMNETFKISGVSGRYGLALDNLRLHNYDFVGRSELYDRYDIIVKYTATCRINNGLAFRELTTLGLTNPWEVAWELVPFSFIADWFIPIGKALSALDAFANVDVESVHKTTIIKRHVSSVTKIGGSDPYGGKWSSSSSAWVVNGVSVTREVLQTIPPLPMPSFKNPLSKEHITNSIALFFQLKK